MTTDLDNLVRDLTKVHPLSKSEVRQRIQAYIAWVIGPDVSVEDSGLQTGTHKAVNAEKAEQRGRARL